MNTQTTTGNRKNNKDNFWGVTIKPAVIFFIYIYSFQSTVYLYILLCPQYGLTKKLVTHRKEDDDGIMYCYGIVNQALIFFNMKWKGNLISCFVYFYFLSLLGSRTKHNWTKPALKNLVPLPKLWLCNQHYTLRLFWFNYMYTELVSVTVLARIHAIIAMYPCSFLYNGKTMTAAWYTNIHVILLAASSSSLSLSLK